MSAAKRIARAFHDEYEAAAEAYGWETQEATRVGFDELPAANQVTMLATVSALLDRKIIAEPHPYPALTKDQRERLGSIAEVLDTKSTWPLCGSAADDAAFLRDLATEGGER